MSERLADIDPDADEAALLGRITELGRIKAAAAAGQARSVPISATQQIGGL